MAGQMEEYRYFVSYAHSRHDVIGFGSIQITATLPIRSMEDVKQMAETIKADYGDGADVVILSWQAFP